MNKGNPMNALSNYNLIKRLLILLMSFAFSPAFAQLAIYDGQGQTGTSGTCATYTVYTGTAIPSSLDNSISSITLTKGYMATMAENENGTGNGYVFIAATSDINVNLNASLNNKVSFIRVLPFTNVNKRGGGAANNSWISTMNCAWFYDWGNSRSSTSSSEYVMMTWGKNAATNQTSIDGYIAKTDISHALSFNEPDNSSQSNIAYSVAEPAYENMLRTGYRMGSPACQEQNSNTTSGWLYNFMSLANTNNARVDFIAIHWYDWGSYSSTHNTSPDVNGVFTRFKNYVNAVHNLYHKPIWITEFNANPNTTLATQTGFMALALPWLEQQSFVERYAYFFPASFPPLDGSGNLTTIGTAYKNQVSTVSITQNHDNSELLTTPIDLVDFSGKVVNDGIKLNWETAQEINNQYFELLRSSDGLNFKSIAKVNGAVNSTNHQFYSYLDLNPLSGTNYYVLKQVDLDGSSNTFKPIAIHFSLANDDFKVNKVWKEGVEVNLNVAKNQGGVLTCSTVSGEVIYKKLLNLNQGQNLIPIPVAETANKLLILTYYSGGMRKSIKVLMP